MDKKNIVITGAGSGLGASLAKKYSEMGNHVVLLGRTLEKLEKTAELLTGDYSIYTVDVSNKNDVSKVFDSIKKDLGTIDILINNAGLGVFEMAEDIPEEATHDMIDINLKGTIFCTQEVLEDMKERNEGIIANVISTAGKQGKVTESVYCASKFGVRGFTESLNEELKGTEVRVYGAYMSGMKTNFWDGIFDVEEKPGLMDPDDVADIIINNIKPRKNLIVNEVVIDNK
ncbi:SDR family oxidoreductase [Oceanobacillus sp. CAU 1775]